MVFRHYEVSNIDHVLGEQPTAFIGMDFGFAEDPTAVVIAYLLENFDEDGRKTIYIKQEKVQKHVYSVDMPAFVAGHDSQQPARWKNKIGSTGLQPVKDGYIITADSANPEPIGHIRDAGLRIRPCKKHKGSVEDGINFLLGHQIIVNPECKTLISEMAAYRYKLHPEDEGVVLPEIDKDQADHCIDALRYAFDYIRLPDKKARRRQSWTPTNLLGDHHEPQE